VERGGVRVNEQEIYLSVVSEWNQRADEYNQWDELDEAEKINFAVTWSKIAEQNRFIKIIDKPWCCSRELKELVKKED
jgi:hypothetical protein